MFMCECSKCAEKYGTAHITGETATVHSYGQEYIELNEAKKDHDYQNYIVLADHFDDETMVRYAFTEHLVLCGYVLGG